MKPVMPATYCIKQGDCLELLKSLPDNSIDAIVTDPPAGIAFMNKSWDGDKGGRDAWVAWLTEVMRECYRVLKPGAHGLVWALPRTSHWTGWALEGAGFEVRDVISHIFGGGFPKSLDVSKKLDQMAGAEREVLGKSDASRKNAKQHTITARAGGKFREDVFITAPATPKAKQWDGWGTNLKPSVEHWWLIRKPLAEKTIAENVLRWETGALNIDASRIATDWATDPTRRGWQGGNATPNYKGGGVPISPGHKEGHQRVSQPNSQGRFPSNLILDGSPEVLEHFPQTTSGKAPNGLKRNANVGKLESAVYGSGKGIWPEDQTLTSAVYGDSGSAARFFKTCAPDAARIVYVPKASKRDRNSGGVNNTHSTVKPNELCRYLCRLITPPNGTILDPFLGSGSTGVGALQEGFSFIGFELEAEYIEIAKARLEAVVAQVEKDIAQAERDDAQPWLFDLEEVKGNG